MANHAKLFFLLLVISGPPDLFAQTLSFGKGLLFLHTNQSSEMVNSQEDFSHAGSPFTFAYEHSIKKSDISIYLRYFQFEGNTVIRFPEGSVVDFGGLGIDAIGYNGVNVYKPELGLKYTLLNFKSVLFIKLSGGIGFQKSIVNGFEYYSIPGLINGPDYVESMPVYADSKNTFQLIPSLGVEISVILLKRFEIGLITNSFYGFSSLQNMYLDYSYKGVKQNKAVFSTSGTGIYSGLSLGFKFY